MKVLVLCARYEPHIRGGAERVARDLASGARDLGMDVVVLTTAGPDELRDRMIDGIRVRTVPIHNVYGYPMPTTPAALKPVWHAIDSFNFPMQAEVARVIREEKPDVIHTHLITAFSASAWTAARKAGIPVVHTMHDHYLICSRSALAIDGVQCEKWHLSCRLMSIPRRAECLHLKHVVGVSNYVLAKHVKMNVFPGVPTSVIPAPCHLVGHEVERSPSDVVRMGFMARIEPNKGIDLLLRSTLGLPGAWTLRVAGVGHPRYVAELQARYTDPRITFVGRVEAEGFFAQTDLLVVPSTSPEAFGLVGAESLAAGVPLVVTSLGGLPELVVHGQTGFVFDPGDPTALASTLSAIVARPSILREMSERCRASVAHLALPRIAEEYRKLYVAAVTGR